MINSKGQFEDSQKTIQTQLAAIRVCEERIAEIQANIDARRAIINQIQADQADYLWRRAEK